MRKPTIRRAALPAVAATAALVLGGCGGGEESSDNESNEGSEEGAAQGEAGGDGEPGADGWNRSPTESERPAQGDESNPPTHSELEGSWKTGPDISDAILEFTGHGPLTFIEGMGAEGDVCFGAVTEGELTLNDCSPEGEEEWTAMSATLEVDDERMVVTWDDGTVQEYSKPENHDPAEEAVGSWSTGQDNDSSSILQVSAQGAIFYENLGDEGDMCDGSVNQRELTLDGCSVFGEEEWTAMSATLEVEGERMVVTWDDGTVQEHTRFQDAPQPMRTYKK